MTTEDRSADRYEAMTLLDILSVVWRGKWILIVVTLLCVGLAVAYVATAKRWYRAEVLLKPTETKTSEGLSGQGGGAGGLASLVGINIGGNGSAERIAVLSSREFTSSFIMEQNLLPVFFASKWDASAKRWNVQDTKLQPDIRDGVAYFNKKVRSVTEDRKTDLVTLTVEWTDPVIAAKWANLLVRRVNDRMRERALTESENNVSFLKQELATSNVVTLQQSIGHVLEAELQKLMLAKANEEFAFRVIDHAEVPKYPVKPQPIIVVAAALLIGISISVLFLMSRHVARRNMSSSVTP